MRLLFLLADLRLPNEEPLMYLRSLQLSEASIQPFNAVCRINEGFVLILKLKLAEDKEGLAFNSLDDDLLGRG